MLHAASQALSKRIPFIPQAAIVLGSGLGSLMKSIEAQQGVLIRFSELPGFPEQTVEGHTGEMIFCELEGKKIVLQSGRFHYYEGHPMSIVTAPMYLYASLGIQMVLHTNAAGAINPTYQVGELMIIKDHINFTGTNPLMGPNNSVGPRFPDMSNVYDPELRKQIQSAALKVGKKIQEGVYIGVLGPSYETPAEIRAFRTMGADAVGMSTVPEVIAAGHAGLKVAGISCLCNMGSGMLPIPLDHHEVLAAGQKSGKDFEDVVRQFIKDLVL